MGFSALALALHDALAVLAPHPWDMLDVVFDRAADGHHALQRVGAVAHRPALPKPNLGDPTGAAVDAAEIADEIAALTSAAGTPWTSRALTLRRDGDGLVLEVHGAAPSASPLHVERVAPDVARHCLLTEPFIAMLRDAEPEVERRQREVDAYVGYEDGGGFNYDPEERSLVFFDVSGAERRRVPADIVCAYDAANRRLVWGHVIEGLAPAALRALEGWSATRPMLLARPTVGCRASLAHRIALSAAALMDPEGHGAYRDDRDPAVIYYYSLAAR
ncbi:MAG: hypothetical protein U0414_26470 [Polyangiaceae bacterium]